MTWLITVPMANMTAAGIRASSVSLMSMRHIFDQRQNAQHQRVKEHQDAVAEALLDGVQVVGVQAHQVADLVDLIVLLGQPAAVVEHLLPQVGRHPDRRAEEATRHKKRPMTMSTTIQIMGRQMCWNSTSLVKASSGRPPPPAPGLHR